MADDKDKIEWWGKKEQPKGQPKATAPKAATAKAITPKPIPRANPKPTATKPATPRAKQSQAKGGNGGNNGNSGKQRLSKMALFLRTLKHSTYMLVIIVGGAVGAHYFLTGITRHDARCTVPQLELLTMAEAEKIVAADGLQLIINDSLYAPSYKGGAILDQLPKAGVVVKPGRAIYLTVNATQRRMVDVPYVAERSLRQAKNMLEMVGLSVGELIYVDDLAKNYVLKQTIDDKEITAETKDRATIGTEVTLEIGRGDNDTTVVPTLIGLTLREARSELCNVGLNTGEVTFDEQEDSTISMQARVYSQSERPETGLRFGDRIALSISNLQPRADSLIRVYYQQIKEDDEMIEWQSIIDESAYYEEDGLLKWKIDESSDEDLTDEEAIKNEL